MNITNIIELKENLDDLRSLNHDNQLLVKETKDIAELILDEALSENQAKRNKPELEITLNGRLLEPVKYA
jgi:hypothetical protein